MKYAIIKDGRVENVVLARETPQNGVPIDGPAGIGWSYDGEAFTPPPPPPAKRSGLTRGQFRMLFTFAERQAEAAFKREAESAAQAGTATQNQLIYLTMRDDFDDAGSIDLDDTATGAALDFYVAFGLLTAARKAGVLSGVRP